jgi:diguanylate cyclase
MLQTDQLTWLNNRHKYNKEFSLLLSKFQETSYVFSCAVLDIDDFKKVNDTYWHNIWDAVLKHLAKQLLKFLESNYVYRFWWEEFLILYPGSKDELAIIINKILDFLNRSKLNYNKTIHIPLTFSWWITNYVQWDNVDTIYERADKLMYKAKKEWKNRVNIW